MLASAINVHSRAIMVDVFLVCHLQWWFKSGVGWLLVGHTVMEHVLEGFR